MTNEKKQYCYEYWRPSVATDCVIFGFDGKKLKILLWDRGYLESMIEEEA